MCALYMFNEQKLPEHLDIDYKQCYIRFSGQMAMNANQKADFFFFFFKDIP